MVISSSNNYSDINPDVLEISSANKINLKKFKQSGQIQIYQSSYRGSYSSIIRDSLRNAALGRKVLLVQFMKGGVKHGVENKLKLLELNNAEHLVRKFFLFLGLQLPKFPSILGTQSELPLPNIINFEVI